MGTCGSGFAGYVAKVYAGLNDAPEAERLLAQSLDMCEKKRGFDDLSDTNFLRIVALVYGKTGNAA